MGEFADFAEYIDVDSALARVGGNKALYKKLLLRFAENNYMDQLKGEIEARDAESAAKTAHLIKGVTSNLSLSAVAKESTSLVNLLRDGEEYVDCYNRLDAAMSKTMENLTELVGKL